MTMKKLLILFLLLPALLPAQTKKNKDSLLLAASGADSAAVDALYQYGELFENSQDDSAAYYYKKAKALAEKTGYKKGMAVFASHYIVILNNRGQFREALTITKEALEFYKTGNDKKELAVAYLNVGSEWQYLSDFGLAAEYYLLAKKMAEDIHDTRLQRITNNNLASVFIELGEPEKGKQYAEKSLVFAKELKNEAAISSSMYNIATATMQLKEYDKALALYKEIEASGKKNEDDMVLLDGWLGTADANSALNNAAVAEEFYNKVISFSKEKDTPEYEMYACMGMADLQLKTNHTGKAEIFINEGIGIAQKLGSKLELKDLYLKASLLNEKKGNAMTALEYRKKFELLNDSIVGDKSKTLVSNLEAKYEFEKKESTIKQLQSENEVHELAISKKNILNYILIGSVAAILVVSLLSYRNYKQQQALQQQRINELETEKQLTATEAVLKGEEKERTRLAKDLHDGLGGILSGIKYSMQNMKGNLIMTPENAQAFERSMDMLDSSIKEMRRVAHNLMPEALVKFGLDTALKDFCNDINQSGALQVVYQSIGVEGEAIPQTSAITIYRIVQELINNTIKHAGATNAIVQLTKAGHSISLTVEDDGKGFDTSILQRSGGIGWTNIQHRIEFLKGKLDVHSQAGKGTSVLVELNM
jgi:two-component system, NarL family, sensor kinase